MLPADAIALCIRRVARAKDGRGPWQAARSLEAQLARTGDATIAANCADAARRIGAWLKTA